MDANLILVYYSERIFGQNIWYDSEDKFYGVWPLIGFLIIQIKLLWDKMTQLCCSKHLTQVQLQIYWDIITQTKSL